MSKRKRPKPKVAKTLNLGLADLFSRQAPAISDSQTSARQLFDETPIHKVFVWDQEGTYLDCHFPNPIHGHFLGGHRLRGKKVFDVLAPEAARVIHQGIATVLRGREPWKSAFEIHSPGGNVRVHIHFIPVGEVVLGLATDHPLSKTQLIHSMDLDCCSVPDSQDVGIRLTTQERAIILLVKQGLTNRATAQQLRISEATVKFHLANIYRKLRISSRYQLINWERKEEHTRYPFLSDDDSPMSVNDHF